MKPKRIFNVCLDPDTEHGSYDALCANQSGWRELASSYCDSAIRLIEQADASELSNPYVYLGRHALELTLKNEILKEDKDLITDKRFDHDLNNLIGLLDEQTPYHEIWEIIDRSEIAEFHHMDTNAMVYRFPCLPKSQKPICDHGHCINKQALTNFLSRVMQFLQKTMEASPHLDLTASDDQQLVPDLG